jgi:hypothetical protein
MNPMLSPRRESSQEGQFSDDNTSFTRVQSDNNSSHTQPEDFDPLSPPRASGSRQNDVPSMGSPDDALSPIRPITAATDDDDDIEDVYRVSAPSPTGSSSTLHDHHQHSLRSNQQWNDSNSYKLDRRQYRTVVPSRVFMSEPSEFPLDDSFSPKSIIP